LCIGPVYDMLKEKGERAMKCSECENEIPEGSVFCPVCGSAQFEVPVEEITPEPVEEVKEEAALVPEEPKPVKKKKKWWILAAAAGVLAVVAALVTFMRPQPGYGVYATSDQLLLIDLSGGESVRLAGNISLYRMFLTKDEKRLFFQEGDDFSRGGLYYLDLHSESKEPVKLTTDTGGLYINDQGTGLAYIRNGNLLVHDLKSETVIAHDVVGFLCDEDMDTFAFYKTTTINDSGVLLYSKTWYFQDGDQEPKLVGDGRKGVSVLGLSADGKTMIYTGDGGIYAWKNGKETVIAEHAAKEGIVYEDMTFYYYTVNSSGQTVLCFYNGEDSVEITDNQEVRASGEQHMARWQDEKSGHCFVAIRDRVLEIPIEQVLRVELSEDGETLYVTTQGEVEKRNLYTVDISRGEEGQAQLLVENAPYFSLEHLGKRLYYWVGEIGKSGELYCDGKLLLENVQNYLQVHEETGTLLVRGEASSDYRAAIYMVRDGKVTKLTDEGGQTGFASNGDALVVTGKAELWCYGQNGAKKLLATNGVQVYTLGKRN